jgi:hypothetical protein
MKKSCLPFLALLLAFACVSRADLMSGDKVSVNGSIVQETDTNGRTVTKPITPATVLAVLAVVDPPRAKDLRFYLDLSTDSIVVAVKGIPANGSGTPLATVYTIALAEIAWQENSKIAFNASNDNTLLNGDLAGSHWFESKIAAKDVETDTRHFIGYGMVSGTNTIMQATISDTFKAAP